MQTTDFYSNPKRTETAITSPNVGIELAFGTRQTITHLYLEYSSGTLNIGNTITIGGGVVSLSIDTTNNTLSDGTYIYKDSKRLLIKLDDSVEIDTNQEIEATQGSNITISEFYAFSQILSFEDGAFNEIKFTPEQRTRGMHKMLNGGYKPYQGLGVMKRKMSFGSNYVPFEFNSLVQPGNVAIPPSPPTKEIKRTQKQGETPQDYANYEADYAKYSTQFDAFQAEFRASFGDNPIFANADISRINDMFRDHLSFFFADRLSDYPDRIFPACFEGQSLDEPFSDLWKGAGYDVSFSVLEL